MREFMLLIHNHGNSKSSFSPQVHKEFVSKCEVYINKLKQDGKLIAAQPLKIEGVTISGTEGAWQESPFNEKDKVQVGYYHILAKDIEEATAIAKGNPEFEYTKTARIEVRPVKTKEQAIDFIYPITI